MLGFNWFDAVIILCAFVAIYRGIHDGFFTQALTNAGLFIGLFLGGWIFPHLLPIHDPTTLTLVNSNMVVLFAIILAIQGFRVGRKLHLSLGAGNMFVVDRGLSAAFTTISILVIAWLGAAMLGRLPFVGLSNSANDALIVQTLDHSLPPVPAVFAKFGRFIDPNSPPEVLAKTPLQSSAPVLVAVDTAKATASVVRITSFGCGGLVSGSGFVAAPHVVATNAHVIAGVRRPIVKHDGRSYAATTILFDSRLDFALLRVPDLDVPALPIHAALLAADTPAAILGYPEGNYATVPSVIRANYKVNARNIYGVGIIPRDAYEVQAKVADGASGGPLVMRGGSVAGIVFAKLPNDDNTAFALTSRSILKDLNRAKNATRAISTGACLAN